MKPNLDTSCSREKNGALPLVLASGGAPGESGVFVVHMRYRGAAHFAGTPLQHVVSFGSSARMHSVLADRARSHDTPNGSLSIYPAGIDASAETKEDLEAIYILVEPGKLSVAAADDGVLGAQLIEQFSGYDQVLFDLARQLTQEVRADFPLGTIFWNETASRFIDVLVAHHTIGTKEKTQTLLDEAALKQLKDFVMANLDKPLDVAALAKLTNRSQFHFSRVFSRSLGVSPYQYIIHLRLQYAIALTREGRLSLAEIAAQTGFADQSHLSRWVRRVCGVSLGSFLPKAAAE